MLQSLPSNIQGELYTPSTKSTLDLDTVEEPENVDERQLAPLETEDIEVPEEPETSRTKRAKKPSRRAQGADNELAGYANISVEQAYNIIEASSGYANTTPEVAYSIIHAYEATGKKVALEDPSNLSNEPLTWLEALSHPDADYRKKAADEEVKTLAKCGTFEFINHPNANIIASKFVLRIK